MQRFFLHTYTLIVLRIVLGAIFIYAGWVKLFDMDSMARAIANYRVVPLSWVNVLAIVIPAVEVIAGAALIAGVMMKGALAIITGLILVFCIAIVSAILRGLNIECGCFGTSDSEQVGLAVLVRDLLMLAATVPIWVSMFRERNEVELSAAIQEHEAST